MHILKTVQNGKNSCTRPLKNAVKMMIVYTTNSEKITFISQLPFTSLVDIGASTNLGCNFVING